MADPATVGARNQMRLRFPAKCFSDSDPGDDLHRIVTSSESGSYAYQAKSDPGPFPPVSEPTRARGFDRRRREPSPSRRTTIYLQLWPVVENAREWEAVF
jgi:hypothetical protein